MIIQAHAYTDASGETLTVKYTDGTEYSTVITDSMADVVLPNGFEVLAYAGLRENYEEGTYDFVITVAYMDCAEYEVNEKECSFVENIRILTAENLSSLYRMGDNIMTGISHLSRDSEFSMMCFKQNFEELSQAIMNLIAFVKYYVAF